LLPFNINWSREIRSIDIVADMPYQYQSGFAPFVTRSLMIWLVREDDSYFEIYYELFTLCNWFSSIYMNHVDEKFSKFNIFLSRKNMYMRNSEHTRFVRVFCEIVNILGLYEYFIYRQSHKPSRVLQYFTHSTRFTTAHCYSNQTVFCFCHNSFFTAAFPQPTAHNSFFKSHILTKHTLIPNCD
jgi:hypothetical protein